MSAAALSPEPMPRDEHRRRVVRFPGNAWHAVRAITLRVWLLVTGLGLLAVGAYVATYAPRVLDIWHPQQLAAKVVFGLLGAYVLLLAISIAEYRTPYDDHRKWRYLVAGAIATIVIAIVETSAAMLLPATIGATSAPGIERLVGVAVSSLTNWSLCGGLGIAVYVRLQAVKNARAAIQAAELARTEASRDVLASRLAAMQAQVEPRFLLGTLGQVEALYDRDVRAGATMLDGLIAYLRAALPQMRGGHSTLGSEARLAQKYLEVMRLRMGSRLDFAVHIPPNLADHEMPPMILLPLIEIALRSGLEPMPFGGKIDVRASVDSGRLRVTIADDGLAPREEPDDASRLATLRARLEGLCGAGAQLSVVADAGRGVTAVIDVPDESESAHR